MGTFVGVLIALLFFIQNLALAAVPAQVTTDPARQGRPEVYGDTIVWKDLRNGNWDVFQYDIPTGIEQSVSTDPAYQNLPVTNGFVIVWQDDRNGDNDIYMRDEVLGLEQPLVTGPGNQGLPAISGNKVVFVDDSSGSNDIYVIDLVTRSVEPVCIDAASQWQPRIDGSRIIWQDSRSGKWDIYLYDMDNPVTDGQPVVDGPGDHTVGDIDGQRVVWQDHIGTQYDISVKDLSTGIIEPVTSDAAFQGSPRLSGDLVVWEDFRNDPDPLDSYYDYDIYMKDLTSGIESPLADGPSIQARPAVDRETVVWEDTVSGNYDVWMTTVPDTTPPVIDNASPAEGSVLCASTTISADVTDNRAGIDPESLVMLVDGEDVTAEATLDETTVSYEPGPLSQGGHTVSLTIADGAGNLATLDWGFDISGPQISIADQNPFWDSYSDYENGILSVDFTFANDPVASPALGLQIVASPASSGVITLVPLPSPAVDIDSGSQGVIQMQYLIPPGVTNFKTTVYITCEDSCGGHYDLPGPAPF